MWLSRIGALLKTQFISTIEMLLNPYSPTVIITVSHFVASFKYYLWGTTGMLDIPFLNNFPYNWQIKAMMMLKSRY